MHLYVNNDLNYFEKYCSSLRTGTRIKTVVTKQVCLACESSCCSTFVFGTSGISPGFKYRFSQTGKTVMFSVFPVHVE